MINKPKLDKMGRPIRYGSESSHWKGGRSKMKSGYVLLRVGKDHPLAHKTGYAYEHRVIADAKPGEQVHHENRVRDSNNRDNLQALPNQAAHSLLHRPNGCVRRYPNEPNPIVLCACGCRETLSRFDKRGRPRFLISGHNKILSDRAKLEVEAWLKKRKQL